MPFGNSNSREVIRAVSKWLPFKAVLRAILPYLSLSGSSMFDHIFLTVLQQRGREKKLGICFHVLPFNAALRAIVVPKRIPYVFPI